MLWHGTEARGHGFRAALVVPDDDRARRSSRQRLADPHVVNREQVALVREEWRVVDRWWTDEPVDRHYFEVVLEGGRNVCVYRDAEASCWFTQNA